MCEAALHDNQHSKGKVDALDSLRQALLQQAQQVYPQQAEVYMNTVSGSSSAGVSRHDAPAQVQAVDGQKQQ